MTAATADRSDARIADQAAMWVDLLTGHLHAESARFDVTRRAELFMRVAALPVHKVLDALSTDEAGWEARLAELRMHEAASLAAASARDRPRA